jgi:hypothetical protein
VRVKVRIKVRMVSHKLSEDKCVMALSIHSRARRTSAENGNLCSTSFELRIAFKDKSLESYLSRSKVSEAFFKR